MGEVTLMGEVTEWDDYIKEAMRADAWVRRHFFYNPALLEASGEPQYWSIPVDHTLYVVWDVVQPAEVVYFRVRMHLLPRIASMKTFRPKCISPSRLSLPSSCVYVWTARLRLSFLGRIGYGISTSGKRCGTGWLRRRRDQGFILKRLGFEG